MGTAAFQTHPAWRTHTHAQATHTQKITQPQKGKCHNVYPTSAQTLKVGSTPCQS